MNQFLIFRALSVAKNLRTLASYVYNSGSFMSQSRFLFLDQDQYKMVSKEIPDSSTGVSKPMSFFIVSLECRVASVWAINLNGMRMTRTLFSKKYLLFTKICDSAC